MTSRSVKVSRRLEEFVLSIESRILSFGDEGSKIAFIHRLNCFGRSKGLLQQLRCDL
jgi:hypothetical protein